MFLDILLCMKYTINNDKQSLYEKRKSQGLCGLCGLPRESISKSTCDKCRKRQSEKYKARRASGLCFTCNEPVVDGASYCAKHYDMRMARRDEKRVAGQCYECGKRPAVANGKRCERCCLKNVSSQLHDITVDDLLRKIDAQDRLCALSGRKLLIGINCHLDHIVPKSRGGTDELSNLRWVDKDINQARHGLLDEEFIQLINEVLNHINGPEVE